MPRKVRTERDTLVERSAIILACGEPTHFAFEAELRHVMRSTLCATGWRWQKADDVEVGPPDLPCLHFAEPAKDRGAVELPINENP